MKIFLIGFMGSGKSTVGKKLAGKLGFQFIDLDEHIEKSYGKTVSEIFETDGEEKFRALETTALKEVILVENAVVATGGGTPCFNKNMDIINRNGTSVYLKMSVDTLTNRLINAKSVRPLIKDFTETGLREYISTKLTDREPYYLQSQFKVKAKNLNVEELAEFVLVS